MCVCVCGTDDTVFPQCVACVCLEGSGTEVRVDGGSDVIQSACSQNGRK